MKVLISKKTGNYYYHNQKGDLHTKEGFIKEEDLDSGNNILYSNTKREFFCFNANSYDKSRKIKRGPQLITEKDLGYIVARTRMGKNDIIVEAGSGSGAATTFFANIVKEVHSYEISQDHLDIVKKNLEFLKIDNVKLEHANLADEIDKEKHIDMLFLDMPNPCEVLEKEMPGLENGKFIVCYVPSISQIQEITKLISQNKQYYLEEISEIILRHWKVWDKVARPNHRKEIDHTAFLVFIRKV